MMFIGTGGAPLLSLFAGKIGQRAQATGAKAAR